jgi:hypothetical protein
MGMHSSRYLQGAILLVLANSASALSITDDFSSLGTVYQTTSGQLTNAFAVGETNVTANFKADANYAASILDTAVGANFSPTITITLANLSSEGAVGDSLVTSLDANNLTATSNIRVDNSGTAFFVDPTPASNANFVMTSKSATLGGGQVNVSRIGNAVAGGPADGKWDLVTLFTHEMEHSIAYTTGIPNFLALAGATGTANRSILIRTALTGLPSSWNLPIISSSSHIDGNVQNGLFNDAVVADPGFGDSQRALLTAAEIDGACAVDGCTAAQLNTNPYAVPLPASWVMMLSSLAALFCLKGPRRSLSSRLAPVAA